MVRVGRLKFSFDPLAAMGNRVSDMELNGKPLEASKEYELTGWASVGRRLEGRPIWDIVAEYLRNVKVVKLKELNVPRLKNVDNNSGIDLSASLLNK
jgi:sulfur-oxidizing protein SoxB